MRQHHYLGFVGMVGQSLRYVAECGDQWLALLEESPPAIGGRPTDRVIGGAFQPLRASSREMQERGRFKLSVICAGLNPC